jgi:hypothetical protein
VNQIVSDWLMVLSTIALVLIVLVGAVVFISPRLVPIRPGFLASGALVELTVAALWQTHRFLREK